VLVLAKEKCRNGHFWVLVAPEKHVLYGYSKQHNSAAVDELLKGYQGYLVADAHSVYNHLYTEGDVIEVGCWAHCRRYFFKSLASEPDRAKVALSHISAPFRVERTIADSPRGKKEQVRRAKSRPLVIYSSNGATPRSTRCWMSRRWRRRSATHAISASPRAASSTTVGSPSPTTSANST
jgi:transposase